MRKVLLCLISIALVWGIMCTPAFAETDNSGNIIFQDFIFKNELILLVDANGDGEISISEAEAISSLNLWNKSIINITGIEHFSNLTVLDLGGNNISDISSLSNLTKLNELYLDNNNNIRDISSLSNLTELRKLWLSHNNISDISSLSNLRNLNELVLNSNPINNGSTLGAIHRVDLDFVVNGTSYEVWVVYSGNNNLSSLSLSNGDLAPAFEADKTAYTVNVSNGVTGITVTPIVEDGTASVTVIGNTVSSGEASENIALAVGENTISIVVTAENGDMKTYTITVTRREASVNNNLSNLTLSNGDLAPAFEADKTAYTVNVSNGVTGTTVTPTVEEGTANVTVNGNAVSSGEASENIALAVGENTISIVVTAENEDTKSYTITVTREGNSNNNLSSLSLSSSDLTPVFQVGTTGYTVNVSNGVTGITVTPTVEDGTASVTVNGNAVNSGEASGNINLAVGENTINIVVTAENGNTKTYTITVTRAESGNNNLSNLTLSNGDLAPAFEADTTSYTANVSNGVTGMTVTPTVADGTASVTVNGNAVNSGVASGNIALNVGENTINIVVTAENGDTKSYTITVTRRASYSGGGSSSSSSGSKNSITDKGYLVEVEKHTTIKEDGTIINTVELKQQQGDKIVRELSEKDKRTAIMQIENTSGNAANQINISVEEGVVQEFKNNEISIRAQADKATIEIPAETLKGMSTQPIEMQIKEATEEEVENANGLVLQLVENSNVVRRPIIIESNYQGRSKIILPLEEGDIPTSPDAFEEYAKSLAVVVQHSNSDTEIIKGTIEYDENKKPIGVSIWIESFSTFVVVKIPQALAEFEGETNMIQNKVMVDKKWSIKFNQQLLQETVNDNTVYILDNKGEKVEINQKLHGNIIEISPTKNYLPSKSYYIYITKEVKSKSGEGIAESQRYIFQTSEYVLDGRKIGECEEVEKDKEWIITFNQEIKKSSIINENIYILDEQGNTLETELEIVNTNKVKVKTKTSYSEGMDYYLIIENLSSEKDKKINNKTWMKFTMKK